MILIFVINYIHLNIIDKQVFVKIWSYLYNDNINE